MKFLGASDPLASNGMNTTFAHAEYTDIHFVHGSCNGNVRGTDEEYKQRFQYRRTNRHLGTRFKYDRDKL
jgi:hypothetical protein